MFQGGFGSSQPGGGFGASGGMGGGGFNQSTGMSSTKSPGVNKNRNKPEALAPVTNCMIKKSEADNDRDIFMYKGHIELHLVSIVGYIEDVVESPTVFEYHICDRTTHTPLTVRKFLSDSEGDVNLPRKNVYVRVVGHLRETKGEPGILAFSVREVDSHNEITLHWLSMMRFMCQKEKQPKPGSVLAATASSGFTGPPSSNGAAINGGSADANSLPGLTPTQNKVFNALKQCSPENQTGLSLRDIQKDLPLSMNEIRSAIDFLSNEGHIFSTVDDEHYKLTDHC